MPKYWVTCTSKFLVEAESEDEAYEMFQLEADYVEVDEYEEEED